MIERRTATEKIKRAARSILRQLREAALVSRTEMAVAARVSPETVKRALEWLRDMGAPIEYVRNGRSWRQTRNFALPLSEPTAEDLQAALVAAGLLKELGLDGPAARARALFDELGQHVTKLKGRPFRPDALRVTQTTAVPRDPRWMLLLLRTAGRGVLRIRYRSPWKDEAVSHDFEPWQLWLHDGVLYVRGHSRTRGAARTFRLAHIESAEALESSRPKARVPNEAWGSDDPRYGIDEDRSGEATLLFSGSVARWVAASRWHEDQKDRWVSGGDVLERRMAYRSCRELARRLAGLTDGLDSIEPSELREEVLRFAKSAVERLSRRR